MFGLLMLFVGGNDNEECLVLRKRRRGGAEIERHAKTFGEEI